MSATDIGVIASALVALAIALVLWRRGTRDDDVTPSQQDTEPPEKGE
jgi:hypothetical protein